MKVLVAVLVLAAIVGGFLYITGTFTHSGDNVTINDTNKINEPMTPTERREMKVAVTAFGDGESIPSTYTCDGADISPQIEWSGVPEGTRSLVLIMEDRDVPKNLRPDGLFVHWILSGISPTDRAVPEGGHVGNVGLNSGGKAAYIGPCPPPQYEPSEHRYIFTLYALDITPSFAVAPEKDIVVAMMQGHIVAQAQYTGRYKRQ